MKPAREPASSRPKPCASLKKPHESCPFAAPSGPRRKKNDRGQRSAFPSETSRFALSILAHRVSALLWLVNDRAALRLRRISSTRQGRTARLVFSFVCVVLCFLPIHSGHQVHWTSKSSESSRSRSRHLVFRCVVAPKCRPKQEPCPHVSEDRAGKNTPVVKVLHPE